MVARQLRRRGITDERVLVAMATVPRHAFVPVAVRAQAYADGALPIGRGQTISQPYIVALMTQLLALRGSERVLEIGTGSGYQAAVLSRLAGAVYSIEIDSELAERARTTLAALGYGMVHVRAGDGAVGWPEAAPFDAIIVTCAPEKVPQPLIDQLKDGGRMVIPVGSLTKQEIVLLWKHDGKLERRAILPVRFVPMTGEAQDSGHIKGVKHPMIVR